MKITLLRLILVVSFLHIGISKTQTTPSFFLMTEAYGTVPVFTSEDEYQEILNTTLATEINPEVSVSQHSLKIDEDANVNFSWYQSGKSELIVLALGKGGSFKDKLPISLPEQL